MRTERESVHQTYQTYKYQTLLSYLWRFTELSVSGIFYGRYIQQVRVLKRRRGRAHQISVQRKKDILLKDLWMQNIWRTFSSFTPATCGRRLPARMYV